MFVKKKNLLFSANSEIDKRTNAGKRRSLASNKITDSLIDLIKAAIKMKIPADFVLFDSWFAYPSIMKKIRFLKKHVIARLKAHYKVLYEYDGRSFNLTNLFAYLKKRRGRSKIITSAFVRMGKFKNNKPCNAKIVFVRERSGSKKWIAFISTDLTLSDEEIIRIYGKRWSIEMNHPQNTCILLYCLLTRFSFVSFKIVFVKFPFSREIGTMIFFRY